MSATFGPLRSGLLLSVIGLALAVRPLPAQIAPATDAPPPLTPEESAKEFRLPPGFRVELVAAEPYLADPVAMAFDERGRIFVCEIHGYNLEGYYDVLELNRQGVLDTAVRRILASDDAIAKALPEQYGTVKLLEDRDGDGRIDTAATWADHLPPCYGVVPARQGVIVLAAPEIIYLADRDGDGQADFRETLFTGFGTGELWTRINNPRWSCDNWIYGVSGATSAGTIRGPHLPGEVRLDSVCFRFKADGTAIEPVSGRTSGFGQAIDDWGDRFLCTNQQHALYIAPLDHAYLARNPFYASPDPVVNISSYGHPARVFPTSQPDPWRLARSKDPAWVKFYGVAEATANGYFTAASGQTIYRAADFPSDYHGNHFSVDNAQNLVHRCLLEPTGLAFTVRRPADGQETEFMTSTEQWFRPVNLVLGPDGALYVVDMYRAIIEDYSAIPRYLQQLYIDSLIAGADKGRIWRVVAEGMNKPAAVNLATASADELVTRLGDSNAWWRETAQRLIVERGDRAAVAPLEAMAKSGARPQARLHALYSLAGLEALRAEIVERAIEDQHYAVRMHALRLSEPWLGERPSLLDRVLRRVDDEHPRVRLQLAMTLGESHDPRSVAALARLAACDADEPWIRAAILSSAVETADELLAAVVKQPETSPATEMLHPLGSIIGARHDDEQIGRLLALLSEESRAAVQAAALDGLIEGLQRGKPQPLRSPAGRQGLARLFATSTAEVRGRALQLAGHLRLENAPEMQAAYRRAAADALDEDLPIAGRQRAIMLLAASPYETLAPLATAILNPRQPLELQLAAIEVFSGCDDPRVAEVLLANWNGYTPQVQLAVLGAIFSRTNRLPALLDAVEQGTVPPVTIDAIRRVNLLESPDPAIRRRAQQLLGTVARPDREPVLARYHAALTGPRDPARGKEVYAKQCAKCHQLEGQGFSVGPDLATVTTRTDETLVADVLDPSSQITVGYRNYSVLTEDGLLYNGVLAAETATSITLRKEEGAETVILRKDIDIMEASSISMMPEELEKEVSPQDIADLIAYLRRALGPASPPVLTLFDDDTAFAGLLTEGDGRAEVRQGDAHSGTAALVIAPPQRWNLALPGWNYRIKETPGPGEFRYLRFAWRSRGGDGVMIELAGDGRWPPAEKPLWRYYSGRNTTGWAAVQVAEERPDEWTVVTRDLWQDFGEFTLTGIAPTAMGGEAQFDRIELLRTLDVRDAAGK